MCSSDLHWAGKHESDVFSLSIVSIPHSRLVATTSIGYTDTWSGTIESPALGLQPFEGDVWFYVDHLSYALGQTTDLTLVRSYYRVDYGDSNLPGAIAYGLDAERYGIVLGIRPSILGGHWQCPSFSLAGVVWGWHQPC